MKYCGCLRNEEGEFGLRIKEIWDEVVEVCEARSWEELKDEVSDVMFGFGRLLGYMCGRVYVKMWFDDRHVKKIEARDIWWMVCVRRWGKCRLEKGDKWQAREICVNSK